ncbi:FtsJ-like methyltransferase [Catovirus CTV1]|uniref:FtsJ-like methyltransferase n=1 Tax=Catovirus CTV1 TaxID=1977631 RepID=A0A1V0SBY7_9VIRU|nr:FtsJ-like methyltransferase [Catovirus CTV1]
MPPKKYIKILKQKEPIDNEVKKKTLNKSSSKKTILKRNEPVEKNDSQTTVTTATDNTNIDNTIQSEYKPIVIELPHEKDNIFKFPEDSSYSTNIDYPRFAYGFQHYIHANKNKMEILNQFENKKKVFRVMNAFESHVDNYDQSIFETSKAYFDIKNGKPDILSRGFYKLWEMLFTFNLIDINQDNFVSAHLAEGPGSFIQATMFFRDKFSKKSKNDKYYAVTLHPEDENGYVPELEKNFVDYYSKEKPQRFILHKTYPKQVARQIKNKDSGDLNDPKTIKLFGGQMKERADFVTADGGFNWNNENTQEQEAFRLIFSQILAAVKVQKKGGSFVCKFFETYTKTSMKFISILGQFYNKVFVTKPLLSRPSNSEKYFVCMDFKYDNSDSEYNNMVKKLENIHQANHKNNKLNLVDIFREFEPNKNMLDYMVYLNVDIANNQFKSLNEIVEFINSQNYYGDVYQMRRDVQILANRFWISKFYPPTNNFAEKIDDTRKEATKLIQEYNVLIPSKMKKI